MSEINEIGRLVGEGQGAESAEGGEVAPQGSRWGKAHHVLLYFLGVGVVVWLATGFYKVDANEVVIVERLGEFVSVETLATEGPEKGTMVPRAKEMPPGQQYGWPWPLEVRHHVPKQAQMVTVADFNQSTKEMDEFKRIIQRSQVNPVPKDVLDSIFDPYLITADKNVLNAKITVQYQIKDAEKYLLSVSHQALSGKKAEDQDAGKQVIGQMAAHVLIREMAKTTVDRALGEGKQELMKRLAEAMNPEAEKLGLGVKIDNVTLEARWPGQVAEAFQSVQAAYYGASTAVNDAVAYRDRVKANAETGDTARILSEAQGYKSKVVAEAQGERQRFDQVYERYQKFPDVTKWSLYGTAVQEVLQGVARTMFVQKGEAATVILEPVEERKGMPAGGRNP